MNGGGNRLRRPARIVTVCLLGEPAWRRADNAAKADAVVEAIDAVVAAGWGDLDAVVFPGGAFWLPTHVGPLEHHVRRGVIEGEGFSRRLGDAARRLADRSPGAAVVAGLRSPATALGASGDQVCVAWRAAGVVGIGRKVWPSRDDTADPGHRYLTNSADYGSRHRLLRLASGHVAVLCACYDMFGIAETVGAATVRTGYIRAMLNRDAILREGEPRFPELRRRASAAWRRLISEHSVSVAIATVHGFDQPGREVYWQRHGIAGASAALTGGLAVAAAHYRHGLPDPASGMLAAAKVPRLHLDAGHHRWAWPLVPHAALAGERWLARLFVHRANPPGGPRR